MIVLGPPPPSPSPCTDFDADTDSSPNQSEGTGTLGKLIGVTGTVSKSDALGARVMTTGGGRGRRLGGETVTGVCSSDAA